MTSMNVFLLHYSYLEVYNQILNLLVHDLLIEVLHNLFEAILTYSDTQKTGRRDLTVQAWNGLLNSNRFNQPRSFTDALQLTEAASAPIHRLQTQAWRSRII